MVQPLKENKQLSTNFQWDAEWIYLKTSLSFGSTMIWNLLTFAQGHNNCHHLGSQRPIHFLIHTGFSIRPFPDITDVSAEFYREEKETPPKVARDHAV